MAGILFSKRLLKDVFCRRFTQKALFIKKSPHDYPVVTGSEHWKRKVRTFFRAHDVDRDGYLTKRDFEMTAHRIAAFMNLDDKSAQDLLKNRLKIWEAIVQGGDPDSSKVSEEVYFSNLLASLNSNFRDLAVGFVNNDFDTMDLDDDGFISPKEHRAFFYGFGIPTEHSAAVFEAFDIDRDGLISREEFIQGAVDFTFSEDENSPYNCFLGPLVE